MQKYIGTKEIKATPMNRLEYNKYRGWELPEDENGEDDGYLVEYLDSPKSNHPNHANYISWSPKEVFEAAYREVEGMNFGLAIEAMKKGKLVARKGWNGKGMFLYLVWGCQFHTDIERVKDKEVQSFIMMKTAQDTLVPWLASQSDMLADDWMLAG